MDEPATVPRLTPDLDGFRVYVEAVGDHQARMALARFFRILVAQGTVIIAEEKRHEKRPPG